MARGENYDSQAPDTIVGATVKIEGDLVSDGDIRVDGMVAGKIKTSKNLYVGAGAKIEADVEAGNAVVAGQIKGDLKVRETLHIQETGRVNGNIACARLAIVEGAMFSGTSAMPEGEQYAPATEEE